MQSRGFFNRRTVQGAFVASILSTHPFTIYLPEESLSVLDSPIRSLIHYEWWFQKQGRGPGLSSYEM